MRGNRNIEIEFARIVSCFIVICLHTSSWYISENGITRSALLIKCFLQDAVPVFWYIMEYFMFEKNTPFNKLLKRTCIKVFFPAFTMMVVSQIISPWIYGVETLSDCLMNPTIDVPNLFGSLLQCKSSMTFREHCL